MSGEPALAIDAGRGMLSSAGAGRSPAQQARLADVAPIHRQNHGPLLPPAHGNQDPPTGELGNQPLTPAGDRLRVMWIACKIVHLARVSVEIEELLLPAPRQPDVLAPAIGKVLSR